MSNQEVTLSCRNYDGTNALIRGLVKPPGINLRVVEQTSVPAMFKDFFEGKYDISEMSLSELIYYVSRGRADFLGIPVFPCRWFRHSSILCNRAANVDGPEQLSGKRLGFLRWVQTAAIWMRGTLVEDYGVSPEKTQWYVAAIHHWDHGGDEGEILPRSGFKIRRLKNYAGAHAAHETAFSALRQGEIDALGTTDHPRLLLAKDKKIKRLFENYKEVEAAYYRKTRILPIMHVIAVRNSAVEKHPDLPEKVFELFSQAKKLGRESVVWNSSLYVAWKDHYLDEEGELFEGDPFAYGLAANVHVIEKFLSYCYDQGIIERRLNPKDIFEPSTWDLREK